MTTGYIHISGDRLSGNTSIAISTIVATGEQKSSPSRVYVQEKLYQEMSLDFDMIAGSAPGFLSDEARSGLLANGFDFWHTGKEISSLSSPLDEEQRNMLMVSEEDGVVSFSHRDDHYKITVWAPDDSFPQTQQKSLWKDNKNIFSGRVFYEDGFQPHVLIDDIAFSIFWYSWFVRDEFDEDIRNATVSKEDIFYHDTWLAEKYHLDGVRMPFEYKNKIGFIAQEDDLEYVFFNGKKVSHPFGWINDLGYGWGPSYFSLFENGILVFVAYRYKDEEMPRRSPPTFFVEVNLNDYL